MRAPAREHVVEVVVELDAADWQVLRAEGRSLFDGFLGEGEDFGFSEFSAKVSVDGQRTRLKRHFGDASGNLYEDQLVDFVPSDVRFQLKIPWGTDGAFAEAIPGEPVNTAPPSTPAGCWRAACTTCPSNGRCSARGWAS